jgi:hypothetical protein
MEDLNLENPIFILYIDVNGYSAMKGKEALEQVKNHFSFKNVTTWIIPVRSETKVELIWQGSKYSTNPGMVSDNDNVNVIKHINEIVQVIIDGTSDESIKKNLRDLQINKVFDN